MKQNKRLTIRKMVLAAMLSALVLIFSMISFPIGDISRFHLGNVMCLLSGLVFGPLMGGFAAGFGSMLYDFTNPLYTPEFWITFITKFAMGFTAGVLYHKAFVKLPDHIRYPLSAFFGAALYVVLYGAKSALTMHYIKGNPWVAVWPVVGGKMAVSSLNAAISIVLSAFLAPILKMALQKAGLFKPAAKQH